MRWFIQFGIYRLRARWRSLLTLIIGVLLSTMIGANASLYTTAISQVGLVDFLELQPSEDVNLLMRTSITPFNVDNLASTWQGYDARFNSAFDTAFADYTNWTGNPIQYAETQAFIPMVDDEDIENTRFRLAYYADLENQVELTEGVFPQAVTSDDIQAEVLIGAEVAVLTGLAVGDVFQLDQRGWETSQIITVRISGLIRPLDTTDSYWFSPSPLRYEGNGNQIESNLFITRPLMETIPAEYIPQPSLQVGWRIVPDYNSLPYTQIATVSNRIETFNSDLNESFVNAADDQNVLIFNTNLTALFTDYAEQIVFLNVPFGLLIIQLSALVLFFLMLIAALVRRDERREIAMLQSRGATDAQIIAARSTESLIICVFATLLAPFLTLWLLQLFIPLFTGADNVPLVLTPQVFLFSGFTALIAFITLTLTLLPVMRQPLVSSGGIGVRGDSQTWWQRYYLDVILLIIGVIALYQLTDSQSVIADNISGDAQIDVLLLIAPTLLFVAFSSVLLRFFPFFMSVIARFFAGQRGIVTAIGGWQVSRESLHYGRITFLLALAIGIGWFAINYQATLTGNLSDQAEYLVGSDVRVIYEDEDDPATSASMQRIAELEGVTASSEVARLSLQSVVTSSGGGRPSRQSGELLAIDFDTLQNVVDWRDELGAIDVTSGDFNTDTEIGISIPENTATIGFWARVTSDARFGQFQFTRELLPYPLPLTNDVTLTSILTDSAGNTLGVDIVPDTDPVFERFDEIVTEVDPPEGETIWTSIDEDGDGFDDTVLRHEWANDGWVYHEIMIPDSAEADVKFISIGAFFRADSFYQGIALSVGSFQFFDSEGNVIGTLIHDTADTEIAPRQNNFSPTELSLIEIAPEFGDNALYMEWRTDNGFQAPSSGFAINFNYPEFTSIFVNSPTPENPATEAPEIIGIPAYVSGSLAELNGFVLEQEFNLIIQQLSPWFTVDTIVDYYPTLYQETPYLVVDAGLLNYTLQRAGSEIIQPNELWLSLDAGTDEQAFIESLRISDDALLFSEIIGVQETLNTFETDILSLGVIGLLYFSFIVGLGLSVVSLLTYIILSVQSRKGEFAVLRALGLNTMRMVWIIIVEQSLVLFASIVLGAIIGQFLTLQVLPPLALSAAGGTVTPPFTLIVDYLAIVQYLLIIMVVLVLVVGMSAIAVRRIASSDALRFSEE